MKDGTLISGSVLSQTEYTLNLATSYGNITLNQREIEQILPDKHRIILKGGTQLIGVILDLDEFNLKLKTDDGMTVNVDMPQIVSIEVYDYDRGVNAQKEFVGKTQQAAAEAQQKATQTAGETAAVSTVAAEGGLTFDSDINQVFGAQKATVVDGNVVTPTQQAAAATTAAPLSDEEAFLKGVKTGSVSPQDYAASAKAELLKKNSTKKKKEPVKRPSETEFSKYFSIQAGLRPTDLKLDNSQRGANWTADDKDIDVGGAGVTVSGKFLWRVTDSNFWVGPFLSISNIPNASFADKDKDVADANSSVTPGNPLPYPDPKVRTSGQILTFGAAANYYLNPKQKFAFYLTANAGYEMLRLNYRGEINSTTINSDGLTAGAGLGVETWVDDVMLGAEVREVFAKRSKTLSASADLNTVFQVQLSWKF